MFCPDCGMTFRKEIDYYRHLIYNEGWDMKYMQRMLEVGCISEEDMNNILKILEDEVGE